MFTNCLLRGMFSFECFLVRLYEQMNISFFCNKHKTLSRLELNFKRRIIVVEVRFENYTWIFPSFRWGIFDQVMRLDHSRTSKNIWWIIYWIVHSFWLVLMIKHTYVYTRFENYTWIFPSFRWGIFDQVMRLDHSRTSKNIWWIIYWIVHSFWLVLMIKHTYVYTCRLDDGTINNILLSLSCNTVKRIPCCCAFVHY